MVPEFRGGTADQCIISWPVGLKNQDVPARGRRDSADRFGQ